MQDIDEQLIQSPYEEFEAFKIKIPKDDSHEKLYAQSSSLGLATTTNNLEEKLIG